MSYAIPATIFTLFKRLYKAYNLYMRLILGAVGSQWTMRSTNRFRLDRFFTSDMASYYKAECALISNIELSHSNR